MSATSVDQRPKGQGNKVSVQNGSIHQKDAVNDDDFEPYLSSQTNQGLRRLVFWHSTEMLQVCLGETWGG
uniref:YTH N6-methyladenosine RNA binding protein F3 n=2 Tax=Artiodactyla TaxID=91561 RepID=A0A8C6BP63_MONMO